MIAPLSVSALSTVDTFPVAFAALIALLLAMALTGPAITVPSPADLSSSATTGRTWAAARLELPGTGGPAGTMSTASVAGARLVLPWGPLTDRKPFCARVLSMDALTPAVSPIPARSAALLPRIAAASTAAAACWPAAVLLALAGSVTFAAVCSPCASWLSALSVRPAVPGSSD